MLLLAPHAPESEAFASGLQVAREALARSTAVHVFADVDGVLGAMAPKSGEDAPAAALPLAALAQQGAHVVVCKVCARQRGLFRSRRLVDGVRLGDLSDLSGLVASAEQVLTVGQAASTLESPSQPLGVQTRRKRVLIEVTSCDGPHGLGAEGIRAALGLTRAFEGHEVGVLFSGEGVTWMTQPRDARIAPVVAMIGHLCAAGVPCYLAHEHGVKRLDGEEGTPGEVDVRLRY